MPGARRPLPVLLLLALGAFAVAATVSGQDAPREDRLVLNGSVTVSAREDVGHVIVLNGTVVVDGAADAVTVLNGDVTVRGRVRHHVVAVNGTARVMGTGRVGGDVVSRRAPLVTPQARVDGSVERVGEQWVRPGGALAPLGWPVVWAGVTVSMAGLALIALAVSPNGMVAATVALRRAPGTAVVSGLAVLVGVPLLSLLAMVTLVGIPLGLGLLLGLAVLYPVGYLVGALSLGVLVTGERRGPWVGALAGLALLRLAALLPVLGLLVGLAATTLGLGGMAVAVARGRRPGVWSPSSPL